ncbi:hypothetical protein IFR05_009968 [Cadophora sp. M221]|nr:hypothetical protein IFR05_009968 [Cadophora sp. M221]
MPGRQLLDPRPRPTTPEHERPEIIEHEPSSGNSYRTSSSRGQLIRDFIDSDLSYERAKVRVEEEFKARGSKIAPPRRRPSPTPTAGPSRTSKTDRTDRTDRTHVPDKANITHRIRGQCPASTARTSRTRQPSVLELNVAVTWNW